jgi:hypothetical protein
MATLVSPQIRWMADQYVNHCGYASAVLSGIAPDQRHLDRGGYHVSVEDLRRFGNGDDYSNSRPDDRNFNIQYGAGVDVSLSPADMRRHHGRIFPVWKDLSDPRRRYFNAVNTWDGSGDAVRLDFVTNTAKFATADHKWHVHDETRRRYLLDDLAVRAKVSVWRGETKAQWLAALADAPEEGDMLVRKGDTGEEVKYWQHLLVELGHGTVLGEPDGKYGPKMEAAVNADRKARGVGPATMVTGWHALAMQKSLAQKFAGKPGKDGALTGALTVTGGRLTVEAAPNT